MIRRSTVDGDLLVPVGDRMRYLLVFRLAAVVGAGAYWVGLPGYRAVPATALVAVSAAYLGLAVLGGLAWKLPRDLAVAVSGMMLLLDGVYLGVVAYHPTDALTPYRYLVIPHLITVTLLASFRTGLKLALWHTLLIWLDQQLRGPLLPALPHPAVAQVAVFTGVLWLVAVTTAAFGAVNERELRRHGYDMRALARLGWRLEHALLPGEVAGTVVKALADDFALDRVALLEVHDGQAALLASHGQDGPAGGHPGADELVAVVLREGRTLLVSRPHPGRDPWLAAMFPGGVNIGLVPLHADGRTTGVVCFEYGLRRGSRIEQRTVAMIEQFTSLASLALVNAALLQQVYAQASTDGLTGAANRRTFDERLRAEWQRATGQHAPLTLVLLDIDHFKGVNDRYGHATGDEVLRQVVGLAQAVCRPTDLVARYGGEEFAILLPDTGLDEALALAERVRVEVAKQAAPVPVTVSLGLATLPHPPVRPEELVSVADQALYHSKLTGRNRVTAGPVVPVRAESAV